MIIVKATALLGIAAIIQAVWGRRASAATRHLVWTLAIASVLVLPIATLALPEWSVAVRRTAPTAADPAHGANLSDLPTTSDVPASPAAIVVAADPGSNVPGAAAVSWWTVMITTYGAVAVGLLMYLMWQHWRLRRLARRAAVVRDAEWTRLLADCAASLSVHRLVRLLRSREHNLPATLGTHRPAIMMPSIAETWSGDRRRAVMLHELAHVARYDCLTQTLAMVACAMYRFHPGVWWVARRLRVERELACDDRVIAAGTEPREYAGHLLEIAYSSGGHRAPALMVAMARPRQLEGRMLAALDAARNRRPPALASRLAGIAAAAVVLCVLAVVTPTTVAADAEWNLTQTEPSQEPRAAAFVHPLQRELDAVRYHAAVLVRALGNALGFLQDTGTGTWEIRSADTKGTVHLRLSERNSSSGSNMPIEQLEGLTPAQLTGAGGQVQFRLRRDAGTFTFEGVLRNGVGAGTFSFAPDPNFPAEMAKRGLARPTPGEQYQLARYDVRFAFLDEAAKQGYVKPQTADLVRAAQHGVQTTYLREMGALGYTLGSLESLITLRDHGITPAYVRELADQGYKSVPAEGLRNARDHGITPEYVRAMREAGYGSLPLDQLINTRDHGITPEYVRELGDAGYRKLPLDQLVRVRDHGITPEYVRELRRLGYSLPIDDLVQARDHGVTENYVREMTSLGYTNLPMATLIRVRDHGVTPQFAQELKALGYDRLPLEDLVTLRDHGITAEKIRSANARAGTRLPVDLLKSLSGGGN